MGDITTWLRQIARDICAEMEVEIIKGDIGKEYVYRFVSRPPHVSSSQLLQCIKGKSSK